MLSSIRLTRLSTRCTTPSDPNPPDTPFIGVAVKDSPPSEQSGGGSFFSGRRAGAAPLLRHPDDRLEKLWDEMARAVSARAETLQLNICVALRRRAGFSRFHFNGNGSSRQITGYGQNVSNN